MNAGHVVHEKGRWKISAPAHVMVKVKRVFERVNKGELGTVSLSDTPENGRDLLWFLDRYPMEISDAHRGILQDRTETHVRRQLAIAEVLAVDYQPRTVPLAVPLRSYQGVGVDLVHGSGHLLCTDQVGLGKSAIGIGMIADAEARPALVTTYPHLQRQWIQEVKKFAPELRCHELRSMTPYAVKDVDVYISTYHKLNGWAETLGGRVHSCTYDEIQEFRTGEGRKYQAGVHISERARFNMGLSATPIYNYGDEMFNILAVIAPGALGTREEFGREWCGGNIGKKSSVTDPQAFNAFLRESGLMLRRTRKDVGRELPPVTRIPFSVDADLSALEEVAPQAEDLARMILREQGTGFDKMRASGELSHLLRQATGIAKAPHVASLVRLIIEGGERVVLYGWHHSVYDIWRRLLEDFHPAFYTGQQTSLQQEQAKRRFVAGETNLLVISLRAGAGIDGLQHNCSVCVVGELDWSPGVIDQCIGRIDRDGQDTPVAAYITIADVGSDPVVIDTLGLKIEQGTIVTSEDSSSFVEKLQIDPEHVRQLARNYLRQRGRLTPDLN